MLTRFLALIPGNNYQIIKDPTNKILSCDCKEDSTNVSCTSSRGNVIIWDYRMDRIAQNVSLPSNNNRYICFLLFFIDNEYWIYRWKERISLQLQVAI